MERNSARGRCAAWILTLVLAIGLAGFAAQTASAGDAPIDETAGDFGVRMWLEDMGSSVYITKYSGSGGTVTVPNVIVYDGKTYDATESGNYFMLGGYALEDWMPFTGSLQTEKVVVPDGYVFLGKETFKGSEMLQEVVIGKDVENIGKDVFAGCPELKTYRLDLGALQGVWDDPGIGKDADGNIMEGVKAFVKGGSKIDEYLKEENAKSAAEGGNTIELIYTDPDPGSEAHTKVVAVVGAAPLPQAARPQPPETKQVKETFKASAGTGKGAYGSVKASKKTEK